MLNVVLEQDSIMKTRFAMDALIAKNVTFKKHLQIFIQETVLSYVLRKKSCDPFGENNLKSLFFY